MTLRRMMAVLAAACVLPACGGGGGELREETERRRLAEQQADSAAADSTARPDSVTEEDYEIPAFADTSAPVAAGVDTTPAQPPEPQPDGAPSGEWTTDETEVARRSDGIAVLRDARAGRNEGFDRAVLEFQGGRIPAYTVEYEDRVEQCGSGDEVRVSGGAMLVVRIRDAQAHTDEGEPTLRQRAFRPNLPVLRAVELICDFEGHVDVVLGLSSRRPYRVAEVANPARLVIDVQQ
ncbi:MAG TPA: hypothetical protein VFX98_06980 [Longimicrobiaceae bacterium]|nr:hypothetical protein [Longimicrobiaceae bacterium]